MESIAEFITNPTSRSQTEVGNRPPPPVSRSANIGNKERGASMGAGALLMYRGFRRGGLIGAAQAAMGACMIYRGASGRCALYSNLGLDTATPTVRGYEVKIQKSMRIERDPQTVYWYWRQLENLPRFMKHLQSVTIKEDSRSHWVAKAPFGQVVEWDAEIVEDVPGHHIAWKSLEGTAVPNAGAVGFIAADNGRSTDVKVSLQYNPPGGVVTSTLARIFGGEPGQIIEEDLLALKRQLEGQTSKEDEVEEQTGQFFTH